MTAPDGSLVITGRIDRADVPGLCERLRILLESSEAGDAVCDVHELVGADAVAVDALARLELTARRLGRRIRVRGASSALAGLVCFCGLSWVLQVGEVESGIEPERQTEHRE